MLSCPESLLTIIPCWHQTQSWKRYHIHRSTNISVLTYTCSIFYKATVPSQNLHSSLEPLVCTWNLSHYCPAVFLFILSSAEWRVLFGYLSSTIYPGGFYTFKLCLILILPNTASQKASTLVWEWQTSMVESRPWREPNQWTSWVYKGIMGQEHSSLRTVI